MQAIVLVGGEGTRLRPLTDSIPKPALTLVDRPFLAYMVEWLAAHGVEEIVFACGFLPDVLREALGDGEHAGVRLDYVAEPERRGTAGAIRFAPPPPPPPPPPATATLALHPVADSSAYGLVSIDAGGAVSAFVEKTGEAVQGEINAGAYVLERSLLEMIPPGREVSIEREVFPRLVGAGLHGLVLDGYWMDIGTPERYLRASWDILEGRVRTRVRPTAPGMFVGAGAEVARDATVGPRAVVSSGCRIASGAEVRGSVLLDGCSIGAGARVTDSVLAPGVAVAAGASLADAVVGRDEIVSAP
jgi:mannose-1-phosphate guanylyltransferase